MFSSRPDPSDVAERFGLDDDGLEAYGARLSAHDWDEDEEPSDLAAWQAAGIEQICRDMLRTTWPAAPAELIEHGVEVMLPNMLRSCSEGLFDVDGADEVGNELKRMFAEYKPDLSFLTVDE